VTGVHRAFLALAGSVLLGLALPACGDDDAGSGGGGGSGSPLMYVLSAIPDRPEYALYVSYADMDGYFDALGIGSPPEDASAEEMNEWLRELADAERSGEVALAQAGSQFALDGLLDPEAYRAEIGLDPADVRQAAETGVPPATLHVLRGDFDPGVVDEAVQADENYNDLLEVVSHGGVDYYTWGEDFAQDFERLSPVHTLGRGGRLALHEDFLFWCFGTAGVTGAIDAVTGAADSLAGRPDFAAMAGSLEANEVYSATLLETIDMGGSPFGPTTAFAAGITTDDDGPAAVLVFAYADEEAAANSLSLIELGLQESRDFRGDPWEIESADVTAEGIVVIAVLHGPDLPHDIWQNFVVEA
jgi:hypothetical protein